MQTLQLLNEVSWFCSNSRHFLKSCWAREHFLGLAEHLSLGHFCSFFQDCVGERCMHAAWDLWVQFSLTLSWKQLIQLLKTG